MDELYRQMWELFWAGATIFGGIGFVWLALELAAGWAIDRAGQARERRRKSYKHMAARHGRMVRQR